MPFFSNDEVTLYYELTGLVGAELVVFLSGLTGDHNNWQLQLQALGSSYHCLTFDWRDTNQSSASPRADYGLPDMAMDVIGLLDGLGFASAHLVGLSMGGAVAQEIALSRPSLVASLTLASSFAVAPPPLRIPESKQTSGNLRQSLALRQHNTLDHLSQLSMPVLVVAGARDRATTPESQEAYSQLIPNAEFCLLEGAAHLLHLEKAGAFNRLLRDFLLAHPIAK